MKKETAVVWIKVYAVLAWVCAAVLLLLGLGFLFGSTFMVGMMNSMRQSDPLITSAGAAVISVMGFVMIVIAAFYAITGFGLWQRKKWARVCAIVFSVLDLFSFPIGTAIGVFGIYLFGFEPNTQTLFGLKKRKK